MPSEEDPVICFGDYRLDLHAHRLSSGQKEIVLRPKTFDVLSYLARNPERLVRKDELFSEVWTGVSVTDDSLVQCVREIRAALRDADHTIIKTVPKHGYVFTLVGRKSLEAPTPPAFSTNAPRKAPAQQRRIAHSVFVTMAILALLVPGLQRDSLQKDGSAILLMMATPTIAVFPFAASTLEASELAGTLFNQVSTELARVPRGFDLEIKSVKGMPHVNTSRSMIARNLDLRYVVTGTLDVIAATRRLSVQLIEEPTNRLVWANALDVPSNVGELKSISARLARQLVVQVRTIESRRKLPDRPAAGHYIIQGRVVLEGEGGVAEATKAKRFFDKAVELEPSNLQALAGYARTRNNLAANLLVSREQAEEYLLQAEDAANRMLAVDQQNIIGHMLRGVTARHRGYHERSLASLEHAREINPKYALLMGELARTKIELGLYHEAIRDVDYAFALSPNDPASLYWAFSKGIAAVHLMDYRAAIPPLLRSLQTTSTPKYQLAWLAIAHHGIGDAAKAIQYIEEYKAGVPNFSISKWVGGWPINSAPLTLRRNHILVALRELGIPEK